MLDNENKNNTRYIFFNLYFLLKIKFLFIKFFIINIKKKFLIIFDINHNYKKIKDKNKYY